MPDGGPRILLCTDGGACVSSAAEEVKVRRGGALWLPACDTGVTLRPDTEGTQVFLAGDGLATARDLRQIGL